MSVDVKLIDKNTYESKMDALILAVSGVSANTGGAGSYSSYEQLQTLIRNGLGQKVFPVGTQVKTERETNIAISKGDSTGISALTIDEDTFLAKVGGSHEGIYEFHFDGAVWHSEDESNVILADYGITITEGTPVVGDHIVVTETAATLVWDILDHDKHTFQNPSLTKGVVIGMHNLFNYGVLPFCPSQLLYYAENGLLAGKYKFTLSYGAYGGGTGQDGTYVFTITQNIPAGGGFRHSAVGLYQGGGYNKAQITGGTITTYNVQPERATIQSGITVSEYNASTDTDAIDLGTFSARIHANLTATNNSTERSAYGSNRWKTSVERQWLNSTARAWKSSDPFSLWYSPQTNFDMPPSEAVRKMAGFLHGFGQDLLDLIQPVAIKTALTDADKSSDGEFDTTFDRIWLQSMTELGFGNNNNVAEGSVFAYWQARNTNADRIKYEGSTARYWWLRSPYPGGAYLVRSVYADGSLNYSTASNSRGVVPACVLG